MLGQSIYISNYNSSFEPNPNMDTYFTSFDRKDEINSLFKQNTFSLMDTLKKYKKKIVMDITPRELKALGYTSIKDFVKEHPVDVLRMDSGFSEEEIMEASNYVTVGVNASNNNYGLAKIIKKSGKEAVAIHACFDKPKTGLDEIFFVSRNKALINDGIEVMAFIPGDQEKVTTLEFQRHKHPYLNFLEMKYKYGVKDVLLGEHVSYNQSKLINKNIETDIIYIPVKLKDEFNFLYNKNLTIHSDFLSAIGMIWETKNFYRGIVPIFPDNCVERKKGCITINNIDSKYDSGEVKICRQNFRKSDKVNVIGNIQEDYLDIVSFLDDGRKIMFIKDI